MNGKHMFHLKTLGTNCHAILVAGTEKSLDCETIFDNRSILDTPLVPLVDTTSSH